MPYSIGDQIAGAVHQGLPAGTDANTAQLIAVMQMLSKAGEHTRDIAQWWEQRPERKARRDEALRDILFQEVASGRKPPEALEHSPEEMAKYLKLNQLLNQYTPENISAAVDNIRVGGKLASSLPAGIEGSAAEATMGEVDNILSSAIRDAKTRTSVSEDIEKSVSKTIQSFSMSNPAETAALYVKAMQLYEANPKNIDALSPAQQAIIAETSKNGDTAKTILNRLQGLTYTVDKNEKSDKKGVMTVTPLFNRLTGQDKVLQTKIIAHIESKTGSATLDNKMDVYNNLFPQEGTSAKFWNPYSEKFQSKSALAKELDSNEGLRLWVIQKRINNEKESLPESISPFGETVYITKTGKFIKANGSSTESKGGKAKDVKSKGVDSSLPSVLTPPPSGLDMEGMFKTDVPKEAYAVPPYSESNYEANQVPKYTDEEYKQNQLRKVVPPPTAEEYQANRFGGGPQANRFGGGPQTNTIDDLLALFKYGHSAVRDQINSIPSGADQDLARFQAQIANKAPGTPTLGSNLEAISEQGASGLRDYINNPGPPSKIRKYLQGSSRIESDFLPPVEKEPGIGNLKNLSEQEQRALLQLLMELNRGVGAQQSPASMQYPGMSYGLRVR